MQSNSILVENLLNELLEERNLSNFHGLFRHFIVALGMSRCLSLLAHGATAGNYKGKRLRFVLDFSVCFLFLVLYKP